ncbi:diphthine methyltransferase [Anopheles maculipalpis]|uniref:diphthine methyltransferase n=1 Tax=Anopheles maculipalpis TaxID=1496333 RepID=UPI0021595552|nr:diphthine methyltransferase [Anopheles maculipalpis]
MSKLNIHTLVSYDTEQPADSVEWCPQEGWENLFVCGTYQLEHDQQSSLASRKGRILLYRFDVDSTNESLKLLQTIDRSAVLDQKWNPAQRNQLAVAGADGMLALFAMTDKTGQPLLEHQTSVALCGDATIDRNLLTLALDWRHDGKRIIASDSHGCVELFSTENGLQSIHSWNVHGFEAWTCAFSRHNENVVFSGGDDCFLCLHDIRCSAEPIMKGKNKTHSAGVTSLLSFAGRDHALLTGSYDENVRLFDERQLKSNVSELALEGGVWRLRSNPHREPNQILCGCMYHNFSVVQLQSDDSFKLIGQYEEHESICYGCDWQQVGTNYRTGRRIIATCSFYDHKLCVSEINE